MKKNYLQTPRFTTIQANKEFDWSLINNLSCFNQKTNENDSIDSTSSNPWVHQEILTLVNYGSKLGPKWKKISKLIGNKTPRQCSYMYDKIVSSLSRSKFTRTNDIKLIELVENGNKWEDIQKKMPTYSIDQLKWRYETYLSPDVSIEQLNKKYKTHLASFNETDDNIQNENTIKTDNDKLENKINDNEIINEDEESEQKIIPPKLKYDYQKRIMFKNRRSKHERKCFLRNEYHNELVCKISYINNKLKGLIITLLKQNGLDRKNFMFLELVEFNSFFRNKLIKILTQGNFIFDKIRTQSSDTFLNDLENYYNFLLQVIKLATINSTLYKNINALSKYIEQ